VEEARGHGSGRELKLRGKGLVFALCAKADLPLRFLFVREQLLNHLEDYRELMVRFLLQRLEPPGQVLMRSED
jgi:hypothetical protein